MEHASKPISGQLLNTLRLIEAAPVVSPPLTSLATLGLTVGEFSELVECAQRNLTVPPALEKKAGSCLGLAPRQTLPVDFRNWRLAYRPDPDPTDYSAVRSPYPNPLPSSYLELVELCLDSDDDALWQAVYPFRVKGEAALRKEYLPDFRTIFYSRSELRSALAQLSKCRGYIFVINMLFAEFLFQARFQWSYLAWCGEHGALEGISSHQAFSKQVTLAIKAAGTPPGYHLLLEASGMAGYRLLPDPDFDIITATRNSATGLGISHETTDGLASIYGWLNSPNVLYVERKGTYLTFSEFIADFHLWSTAGSSSFGRLTFKEGTATKTVKARKLMLMYISQPEVLEQLAKRIAPSEAVSLVKSELAKIRIAVASDLGFYLVWSYLHHLYGNIYTSWPGVTLNETPAQEAQRMYNTVQQCKGNYGYPADFEKFDSQPLTSEIRYIGNTLLRIAATAGPIDPAVSIQSQYGLEHSYLSTPKVAAGGHLRQERFRVKDYLPSGIAITSAIGNAFNCKASCSMLGLVYGWTRRHPNLWLTDLALRGDDSSFICRNEAYCLLLALAAKVLGYVHAEGKVAITAEATELLRVAFSPAGCRGYPMRIIPSLTQRKPWSNEPWGPEDRIVSQWATCSALERRGLAGLELWSRLTLVWARVRQLPTSYLSSSRMLGGLGLGPPGNLAQHSVSLIPDLSTPLAVTETSTWAIAYTTAKYTVDGIVPPPNVVRQFALEDATALLTTVDIPEAARANQQAYKEHLTRLRSVVAAYPQVRAPLTFGGISQYTVIAVTELMSGIVGYEGPDFSSFSDPLPINRFGSHSVELVRTLAVRRLHSAGVQGIEINPVLAGSAADLARRWRCASSIATDWLLGQAPSNCYYCVHPTAQYVAERYCIYFTESAFCYDELLRLGFAVWWQKLGWLVGGLIYRSKWHQLLYRW